MISTIFNRAAALRVLTRIVGSAVRKVEVIRQLKNRAIQLTYRIGKAVCSTFVSAKAFEQDFESYRREGASQVEVRRWGAGSYQNHYDCKTEGSDRTHVVKLMGGIALCSCEDYQKQLDSPRASGDKPICKHAIATLNYLGFDSLQAYIQSRAAQIEQEEREAIALLGF